MADLWGFSFHFFSSQENLRETRARGSTSAPRDPDAPAPRASGVSQHSLPLGHVLGSVIPFYLCGGRMLAGQGLGKALCFAWLEGGTLAVREIGAVKMTAWVEREAHGPRS